MNRYALLFALVFLLNTYGYAQKIIRPDQLFNLSETDPVDKVIQSEASNLDSLIMPTSVWISDQVATQFDPTFGVILNKGYILKFAKENSFSDLKNLFRLILSHEKMHALQHMRLRAIGRSIQVLTQEEKKILECQADMCAGFLYMFPYIKQYAELLVRSFLYSFRNAPQNQRVNRFPVPNVSTADSSFVFANVARNLEGLQLFFALGENDGLFASHPNPNSRKTAFEMGVNAFHFQAMQYPLAPSLKNKISPEEWEYLTALYNGLVATLGLIPQDFQPQGFFEVWSQRIAKKIVHLSNKAAKNILFVVKESRWDTSITNPLHYFEIEAKNNNPDSMMIDMDIMTKLVPRKNADDPLKSRIAVALHYLFIVPPKGTYAVRDSIAWMPGTDSTMPSVSYPGEEGSLYTVFPTNGKAVNAYALPAMHTQTNPALNEPSVVNEKLFRRLPLILREFNSFEPDDFKDGAGLLWKDSGAVEYCAYIGREQFSLFIPLAADKKPFLSKTISTYDRFSDAVLAYDEFKKGLTELGESYAIEEDGRQGEAGRFAEIRDQNKKAVYSLRVYKEYMTYKLLLTIFRQ